jgi:hypothetical protein
MRDTAIDNSLQYVLWLAALKTMASLAMFPMPLTHGTLAGRHYRLFSRLSAWPLVL